MGDAKHKMVITLAWWVIPYVRMVAFFAALHGVSPDKTKLERMIVAGIKIHREKARNSPRGGAGGALP